MANLPVEVLLLIFPLIVTRDKLECMTVCKKWNSLIYYDSLFLNIVIRCQKKLDKLIEKVKKDTTVGTKVHSLTVKFDLDVEYITKNCIKLFPKLRDFTISTNRNYSVYDESNQFAKLYQHHPWCDHIEKIIEHASDVNTRILLSSGLCKNLTCISTHSEPTSNKSGIIKLLSNAPALKILELVSCDFAYSDLELIHESAPFLKSLVLKDGRVFGDDLPVEIKPAISVKSFKCFEMDFSDGDGYNVHIPYITQKYTQLEELALDIDAYDIDDEGDDDLIELKKYVNKIMTSYLKKLAPHLQTLSLRIRHLYYAFFNKCDFTLLDECEYQIKNLEVDGLLNSRSFEQLTKTYQVQHLQSLSFNEMVRDTDAVISWKWLRRFKTLKELSLHFSSNRFHKLVYQLNLSDLLKSLNETRLKTLRLTNVELAFDSSSTTDIYHSLNSLTLSNAIFQPEVDSFISKTFPTLKRLILNYCFRKRSVFILANIDLSYLEINNVDSEGMLPILVITLGNNQRRLYNMNSSQPFGTCDEIPRVTIVCNSLYTLANNEY